MSHEDKRPIVFACHMVRLRKHNCPVANVRWAHAGCGKRP